MQPMGQEKANQSNQRDQEMGNILRSSEGRLSTVLVEWTQAGILVLTRDEHLLELLGELDQHGPLDVGREHDLLEVVLAVEVRE